MMLSVNQKVFITLAETSVIGGGRHRGVIENVVRDMFDDSILYLVKTKGGHVVPVRDGAIELYKTKSNKK